MGRHQTSEWQTAARKRKRQGQANDEPCAICGQPIDYTLDGRHRDGPTVDHPNPLALGGSLTEQTLRMAHNRCNSRRGAAMGNKLRGRNAKRKQPRFSLGASSDAAVNSDLCPNRPEIDIPFSESVRTPGEFDGTPSMFPAPHPDAVASLGDRAAAWIEARMAADRRTRGDSLRWWQWLVLQRLLEHRADGSWCWPVSFVSVSRQQGKSELLCELAAFRCAHPGLFGGWPQDVGHSASTVVLSRMIQSSRWYWASEAGLGVARQLGDSQLVWGDGSVWRTMAPENMYGRSLDLVLADEAWCWDATNFWQATFPTMAERPLSQAVLWSAAHDTPKSLVATLFENPAVARMQWGADLGADPQDPAVWREASAFWSPGREASMRMACGQPSFATQWLNVWPAGGRSAWIPPDLLARCVRHVPAAGGPAAAAVECDVSGRWWSAAWCDRDGAVTVLPAVPFADAVAWLRRVGAPVLLAHPMVAARLPVDLPAVTVMRLHDFQAAVSALREAVTGASVSWDHGPEVAEHFAAALMVPGDGGPRLVPSKSDGDVSLVKAIAAVVWHASQRREPVMV